MQNRPTRTQTHRIFITHFHLILLLQSAAAAPPETFLPSHNKQNHTATIFTTRSALRAQSAINPTFRFASVFFLFPLVVVVVVAVSLSSVKQTGQKTWRPSVRKSRRPLGGESRQQYINSHKHTKTPKPHTGRHTHSNTMMILLLLRPLSVFRSLVAGRERAPDARELVFVYCGSALGH